MQILPIYPTLITLPNPIHVSSTVTTFTLSPCYPIRRGSESGQSNLHECSGAGPLALCSESQSASELSLGPTSTLSLIRTTQLNSARDGCSRRLRPIGIDSDSDSVHTTLLPLRPAHALTCMQANAHHPPTWTKCPSCPNCPPCEPSSSLPPLIPRRLKGLNWRWAENSANADALRPCNSALTLVKYVFRQLYALPLNRPSCLL